MTDALIHLTPANFTWALLFAAAVGALAALALAIAFDARLRARARLLADPDLAGTLDADGRPYLRRRADHGQGTGSVERFYVALLAGEILPGDLQPCRSDQLYDLYLTWCERGHERAQSVFRFSTTLRREFGVAMTRTRYLDGDANEQGPVSVYWLGVQEHDDRRDKAVPWIGHYLEAMARAVQAYRDNMPPVAFRADTSAALDQLGVLRHQVERSRSRCS